jgi:hypothetical protein
MTKPEQREIPHWPTVIIDSLDHFFYLVYTLWKAPANCSKVAIPLWKAFGIVYQMHVCG